ncbi:hypothetical protein EVAR_78936_1 [Eumeta japonica]|uniref:Uncharacterized protein n=1 Tax=Eumeta variegata TaxID=151549 RepID=A0A4C1U370_EUMVA|nr:hypothetical protein EVAR_78936_1 [Eumeta japonica]
MLGSERLNTWEEKSERAVPARTAGLLALMGHAVEECFVSESLSISRRFIHPKRYRKRAQRPAANSVNLKRLGRHRCDVIIASKQEGFSAARPRLTSQCRRHNDADPIVLSFAESVCTIPCNDSMQVACKRRALDAHQSDNGRLICLNGRRRRSSTG